MSDAEDRDQRRETDDEEEDTDEEDDFMKGTTLAKSDMKRTFNGEVTEEQIKRFFQDHHEIVAQPGQDGSFLHIIIQAVYDKTVSASNVKPLIERIMTMYPDLLKYPNSEDQTPLYRAIYLKRYTWKLVDYMLDSCSEQKCVEDALERPCSKGEKKTCLTLAFEKDLKAKVLKNLINHAREKALELSDGSGRTPFHSAVKYEQCSDERVDVIRLLLDIDQKAAMKLRTPGSFRPVETFLDHKYMRTDDHIEYSVYGEHERTAKAYLAAEQVRKEKEEREDRQRQIEQERPEGKTMSLNPTSREKDPPKLTPREKDPKSQSLADRDRGTKKPTRDRRPEVEPVNKSLEERERQRQQLRENERRMKEERDERGPQRESFPEREASRTRQFEDASVIISKIQTNQIGTDHAPNTPLKRVSTQTLDIEEEKKRRNKKVASSSKSASKKPDPKVLAKNSATILRMLKLHYMRTRTIKMATAFLYGKNIQQGRPGFSNRCYTTDAQGILDIQICFDYEGLPSEIQDHVFNERFGKDRNSGIKFDEVLMYVRFPSVTVIRTVRKAQKPRALGRQDMEFFFDWLYNKGVRRILKVEVEEGDKIQHSDESIQNALDKITVEHLDWQKTDLEPRVICRISSKTEAPTASEGDLNTCTRVEWKNKLREVTLKWSGNNAVLRAWSEPEGLPQLQKLKVVNLSMPAYSDSNLEEFRLRLNKNVNLERTIKANTETSATSESGSVPTEQKTEYAKTSTPKERKIGVTVREGKKGTEVAVSSGGAARIAGRTNPVTEHEWLNCMERFAGCMDVFWKYTKDVAKSQLEKVQNDGAPLTKVDTQNMIDLQNLGKDVVVALIDDGVDSCDLAFSGRAIEGKTFDYQDGGVGQYYISAKGHGTEMARMILKVCPMATIYSIRLKTHSDPDSGLPTIDAASAALAIEAALEKHATIISMSWTLPIPEEGSQEKQLLDSVLKTACNENVLMFCSSADKINKPEHYPSAYMRKRFFLIGAAHGDGTAYGHAGKSNDFIFPGVNVNTSSGSSLPVYLADKTSSNKESTGSSIATALAAGLAAMVTYCFKASALAIVTARMQQGIDYVAGAELVKPGDVDKIAEHNILKTAFSRIGKIESGQFIPVWDRFGPASLIFEADGKTYEEKLTCIMNLCSNLIER
ncbi:hypothetical protein ACHAPV_009266 [Trichoderma viride]